MRNILLPFILLPFVICAQNIAPVVVITNAIVDEGNSTVTVTYDLSDAEGDACTVYFRASATDGATFLSDVSQVNGAVGGSVVPGTDLSITWTYSGIANILDVIIKVVADDGNVPDIQEMVDQVTEQDLSDLLSMVAIPRHHLSAPTGLTAVRNTIWNTFSNAGLQTSSNVIPMNGTQAENIIGRQPGMVSEANTYIVDAHYDAVANAPGADDNATGVVATLAIAEILSNYQFKNSLRCVGFAFEEQGLIGSTQYVQSSIPSWETINGVLNMEMIGFYSDEPNSQSVPAGFELLFPAATAAISANENRGDFLTVVGNTASQSLIDSYMAAGAQYVPSLSLISLAAPGNAEIAPDLRRSDHTPFWESGRQALMLTDGSNFRNPNYHTPNDAIATIDIAFLTNCTKATLAAAAMLAEPIHAGTDTFDLATLVGIQAPEQRFPCNPTIQPNPVKDNLEFRLGGCQQEKIKAQLFDLKGNKLVERVFRHTTPEQLLQMPTHNIASGSYLLDLSNEKSRTTLKVEIRR